MPLCRICQKRFVEIYPYICDVCSERNRRNEIEFIYDNEDYEDDDNYGV